MKKKSNKTAEEIKTNSAGENDEESLLGDDTSIDPSIIDETFEEFSEYNDVDNF